VELFWGRYWWESFSAVGEEEMRNIFVWDLDVAMGVLEDEVSRNLYCM
jgi:hypothetical protein